MSDAIDPFDLIGAQRIYVPSSPHAVLDLLVIEDVSGRRYSLIALLGEDRSLNEEFFVLQREDMADHRLPEGGIWKEVNTARTVLTTIYKSRASEHYKCFQEFDSVQFHCDGETISIDRGADEFGVEKLHMTVRAE